MDLYSVFDYTITGTTILVLLNMPTGNETRPVEIILRGDFSVTLPPEWEGYPSNDNYSGTVKNHIITSVINGNVGNELIFYSLVNMLT